MSTPDSILILREEGYHTDTIGTCANGNQYMGFTFYLEFNQKRLVSVLHLFDANGVHLYSNAWESSEQMPADAHLKLAMSKLSELKAGNIKIKPFSIELLGCRFGLVKGVNNTLIYEPLGLSFHSPWDGTYST